MTMITNPKLMKTTIALLMATALFALPGNLLAAEKKAPKPYPLEKCAVSDEKLGDMGEPFVFEHDGREVKLCCESCKKDFDKEPAKFTAKIDEAAKKVKKYPLKTCLVSGEPIDEAAPAAIHKAQEFKFCCKDCQKKFVKDPAKFAAKLPKS